MKPSTEPTGTPEHREDMIEYYMHELRMSRREAEAEYRYCFPGESWDRIAMMHRTGRYPTRADYLEDIPEPKWFVAGDDFIAQELEPRATYLADRETGATVLYQASLNQLFATRGLGKSIVTNALLKCLIGGKDFLRLKSDGGLDVLLVDAELPPIQLQERLKEFGETGNLTLLSPYLMPDPKAFPNLSQAGDQQRFLDQLTEIDPQVIIFDTLTRCFRFDTNDADAWLQVNDFLTDLRSRGYCVLIVHHAGKTGTQRGRTDGDDNLDVSIQLTQPYGWQPGDGLCFKWSYSKVRHGGILPDFEAAYDAISGWQLTEDSRMAEVLKLHRDGKSTRAIAASLDMTQSTVSRLIRQADKAGLSQLNQRADSAKGDSPPEKDTPRKPAKNAGRKG